ncbi:hypothetical protein MNBD_NITROSPINAE01-701 [hydrothermal vent metagenome]|uniref:Lipopolysaccharide export system permease protein LptG n=1 Tax=hydrothermal vent metagenome TaxID=652676 RepID=A0A3B1C1N1_9ZZZZ
MQIIDKYILAEFFRIFFLAMITLIVFYEMVLFFDTAGYFIKHKSTFDEISRFMLFKIPTAFFHVTPISTLMAAVLTTVSLARHNEIVALKTSGVSMLRIALPMIVAGGVISVVSFVNNEYFVYLSAKEAKRIYYDEIKEQPRKSLFSRDRFWYKADDGSIWNIGHIGEHATSIKDLSIFYFDKAGTKIVKRVNAKEGELMGDEWLLKGFVERDFFADGTFEEHSYSAHVLPAEAVPSADLDKVKLYPEEMNLVEMREYVRDIRSKGYDATKYVVEMYAKISFPLISLVITLVAIPMGTRSSRAGGALIGVGVAVVTAGVFWFTFSLALAFGHAGRIPPLVAAYGTHFLFGGMGLSALVYGRN